MDNLTLINTWKQKQKGVLINKINHSIKNRRSLTCDHCERRYDDDMCDSCLSVMLVDMFQESLISANKVVINGYPNSRLRAIPARRTC